MFHDLQIAEAQALATQSDHILAMEQVVRFMNEYFAAALSLDDLADVAGFSPYYFCRVFHSSIGIPPGEFLSSLRLAAAKRLLLTTTLSVTDICFDVGYCGLGSFTTRFSQLVGVPPRLLRTLAQEAVQFTDPAPVVSPHLINGEVKGGLSGTIQGPATFDGVIFAGLFPKPIPQGHPVSCTMLTAPGPFHIPQAPSGRYFLMVAAFPRSSDPQVYLLPHDSLLVASCGPILVRQGVASEPVSLSLRPLRPTDPPILSALPFL
jgi:AraC family transcriptional regulator